MSHPILLENWSEYNNRKMRDGRDRTKFSCETSWEKDYLVRKLKKYFSAKSLEQIRTAIDTCCQTVTGRERTEFVDCVVKNLE